MNKINNHKKKIAKSLSFVSMTLEEIIRDINNIIIGVCIGWYMQINVKVNEMDGFIAKHKLRYWSHKK